MPLVQSLSSLSARKALFYVLAGFVVCSPLLLSKRGVGMYQIRQGFAFAVLLYFGARYGKLIMAALASAMIHTTFAVVLPFAILSRLRASALVKLLAAAAIALALAVIGGSLFEAYGGR